ncbi:MAG: D-tyrosyl-tRNA(Tyr) deacylase [Paludibacteraceae bacterium]|nr:D-tyrosyl-tRNA(Tyr) deacylase [Paludibacteraceae bacterium]
MRTITQRVRSASVSIGGQQHAVIGHGLLVLVGFEDADTDEDLAWMTRKLVRLRIFDDRQGVMNCSVQEVAGSLLIVSQFTLHARTAHGNRPSYAKAAAHETARALYDRFLTMIQEAFDGDVQSGVFGADMQVSLINDGPVTLFIDSKNRE